MKRLVVLVAAVALAAMPAFAQEAARANKVDVTGTWELTVESPQGAMTITANYKQDGETLTGSHVSEMGESPLKGTVKGVDITRTPSPSMPEGSSHDHPQGQGGRRHHQGNGGPRRDGIHELDGQAQEVGCAPSRSPM